MTVIYHTTFTQIGELAREALKENMLITFKQEVPSDLADYCFIHTHGELIDNIQVGDILYIDEQSYSITAIGDIANINFRELGHVTLRFDGAKIAEYPGTIHLQGNIPTINLHSNFIIKRL